MSREIKFREAITEGLAYCLETDPTVYLLGLGADDPKALFGTAEGLSEKFGKERVLDMPTAESGMTGIAIGSALVGRRPIMVHLRIEFAMLAMEQIANQAAKWYAMFGGQASVPMVIRLVVGRGWGQGPQHCQSLQAWFAHIPGLKVLMPATPRDAKGMLIAAVQDNDPVVIIEHRWLHETFGEVPEEGYTVPIGVSRVAREGSDLTIVATSFMVLEALQAAELLATAGIEAEVIDVRTIAPFDYQTVDESIRKTGRLMVTDTGWGNVGFAAEVVARASEQAWDALKTRPRRVCLREVPTPTSRALANPCYPRARELVAAALEMLGKEPGCVEVPPDPEHLDVPDAGFRGPF